MSFGKQKPGKVASADPGYIVAKLEEIHDDVVQLQEHVDQLRQESAERRVMWRVLLTVAGGLGAVLGWVATHIKLGVS